MTVLSRPNLIHFSFREAKMTYFHLRRFAAQDENVIFASLKLKWIRLCLDKTVMNVIFLYNLISLKLGDAHVSLATPLPTGL